MKDNLKIYLISGKARHGKTTTANFIKDYYDSIGKKAIVTSFARYIKMYAKDITSWDGSDINKPRELLQSLGTDVIRGKLNRKDLLVKRIDEDMDVYNEYFNAVIIDDVRLEYEMDYFVNKYPDKVIRIKIIRPNFESNLSLKQKNHDTEIGLDNYHDYDYTITNDSTLDKLNQKVISIMEGIEVK